jgi:hypothetical protein
MSFPVRLYSIDSAGHQAIKPGVQYSGNVASLLRRNNSGCNGIALPPVVGAVVIAWF